MSDRGLKRTNNEDSVLVLRLIRDFADRTVDGRFLAVADGMGGRERGEIASRLTLTALAVYLSDRFGEVPEGDVQGHLEFLRGALVAANERVQTSQDPRSAAKMGSTLVVAYLVGRLLFVAHAGDSRCYLLRDRGIQRVTRDDSLVQDLVDAKEITQAQAAVHPQRNRITSGIGIFPPDRFKPTVRHLGEVRDVDYLLLCSDGLHGVVDDAQIAETVYGSRTVGTGAGDLLEKSIQGGAPDNVSLVLAQIVSRGSDRSRGGFWSMRKRGGR